MLAILTTAACGFVLTAANGARRAETSWSRLEAATDAPDALASSGLAQLDSTRATIAARGDVAAVGAFTWMPVAIDVPGTEGIGLFGALGDGFGDTVWRPLMLRGRLANPDRVDEITINEAYAELSGVEVGDRVHLKGPGIDQPATIVGIHRSSLDIGPNGGLPSAVATRAFVGPLVADAGVDARVRGGPAGRRDPLRPRY